MIGISIISVIVLLGVLIFAHELGHFLAAKWAGVGVLKFSLGFGRKLYSRKIGETEYLLSLVPLGGYVKLMGESEAELLPEEERHRSFSNKSVWVRMGIVLAGPVFNFILAILIFTAIYMAGVPTLTSTIGSIQEGSAALEAGMLPADTVVAIDGKPVRKWEHLAEIISASGGRTLRITVDRAGIQQELSVTPRSMKAKNLFGEEVDSWKIGVTPDPKIMTERLNPAEAFWVGLKKTWYLSELTLVSIVKIFEGVISPKTLGGPIFIAQLAGAQVKEGLVPFFLLMALLSINLGVLNLLPIPILDGGHLLFYVIEAVIRRPVSMKIREIAQQVGFAFLILLMVFVFGMDIDRLLGDNPIYEGFVRFFTGK
ncbi:MAG: RIP metalloprotease RseP [Deltaproteobacteria bacterium HGW-Deltaproteobacteria-19]|nr:MAG: RIP metalloprotease RseP [Deltaproteobacteria bacterium HGW-Deltaproteobacteria-19]